MLTTPEQNEIIALANNCSNTDVVLVEAAAGTGKTTTLKHLVAGRRAVQRDDAILYLAFNREAVTEAVNSPIFQEARVDIRTCNSLTMKWWSDHYLVQLTSASAAASASAPAAASASAAAAATAATAATADTDAADISLMFTDQAENHTDTIIRLLGDRLNSVHGDTEKQLAALFSWQTFERFCLSQDRVPSDTHVDQKYWTRDSKKQYISAAALPYAACARHLFSLVEQNHPDMLITFAAVDKLCSLSRHQFQNWRRKLYDIILVDEAQDWNPAQLAMVTQQDCAMQIFVGDSNQSLYSFRGAAGDLQPLKCFATRAYKLRTSFRFGRAIATVANHLLWWKAQLLIMRKKDTACCDMTVVGGSSIEGRVFLYEQWSGPAPPAAVAPPSLTAPLTILVRTNRTLVKEVCLLIKQYGTTTNGFTVTFASSKYNDLESFMNDAEPHLSRDLLESCLVHGRDRVNVCARVLTVHYAKGLEFERVRLADDLKPLVSKKQQESNWNDYGTTDPATDLNLWYVAVTRAKEELQMNKHWSDFLQSSNDDNFQKKFGEFRC